MLAFGEAKGAERHVVPTLVLMKLPHMAGDWDDGADYETELR